MKRNGIGISGRALLPFSVLMPVLLFIFIWGAFFSCATAWGADHGKAEHDAHHDHDAGKAHAPDDMTHDASHAGHGENIERDSEENAPETQLLPFEPAGHDHSKMTTTDDQAEASVKERIGEKAFLDAEFRDDTGKTVFLADVVNMPTLLLPVYFHCPSACLTMMGSLSSAIDNMPMTPGKEFRAIALSFDDEETVLWAEKTKKNHLAAMKKDISPEDFLFLTGTRENIHKVMDGIGYTFTKTGTHTFIHPNALVVLAHDGTIIRYLYGPSFLPFDMGMAITEAEKGTPGVTIRKLMTYCFDYDPENKTYVFKAFRITALTVLALLFLFFFFVLRKRNQ